MREALEQIEFSEEEEEEEQKSQRRHCGQRRQQMDVQWWPFACFNGLI